MGGRAPAPERNHMNPPRWSEALLRMLLPSRDRDTISGDLLEEYREVAVPMYGPRRARWWYRRQVVGFLWQATRVPTLIGLTMGAAMGLVMLADTVRQPLADDEAGTMLGWAVAVLVIWTLAAAVVTWRTERVADAVKVGVILGVATLLVFHIAALVRVNLFLDVIQHRNDWQNLVVRYHESGFQSLRAYANYEYVRGTPMIIGLGALGGSLSGAMGALVKTARHLAWKLN